MYLVIVAIAVVIAVIAASARQPDPARRAQVLRQAGFALTALSTFVIGVFIAGDTFVDPGGWEAAGLVAAWAIPLAGLAALAWYRPGWASYVFAVLAAAVIGVSVWFAADPHGWRSFEDGHGPVRAAMTFVLAAATAVLGLKRPGTAGALLLIVGVVPAAVSSLGGRLGFTSLAVVGAVPVITGILYLVSARIAVPPASPARPGRRRPDRPRYG